MLLGQLLDVEDEVEAIIDLLEGGCRMTTSVSAPAQPMRGSDCSDNQSQRSSECAHARDRPRGRVRCQQRLSRQIAAILDRIFGEFEYVEDAFIRHAPGRSRHLAIPLKFVPLLRQLFRFAHTRVILARKRP